VPDAIDAAVDTETDDALVARARDGDDERAFAELVRRYRQPVFRLVASILGHGFEPEAEEVTQEVFVRVHGALASFRGDAKFGSWLYRIAFNQALNLKARVRYRSPHLAVDALRERPSPESGPFDRLAEAQRDRVVLDCVAALPEAYQAAVRLHYWMDASIAEIASLLAVPENTVKSYLYRARRLLEAMLKTRGLE
jgi:RNA polymerase sigma-70 factor, ECF subfamily